MDPPVAVGVNQSKEISDLLANCPEMAELERYRSQLLVADRNCQELMKSLTDKYEKFHQGSPSLVALKNTETRFENLKVSLKEAIAQVESESLSVPKKFLSKKKKIVDSGSTLMAQEPEFNKSTETMQQIVVKHVEPITTKFSILQEQFKKVVSAYNSARSVVSKTRGPPTYMRKDEMSLISILQSDILRIHWCESAIPLLQDFTRLHNSLSVASIDFIPCIQFASTSPLSLL